MRILGIDPGYAITGWGIIESAPSPVSVDYGAILTDSSLELSRRLSLLFEQMEELVAKYRPEWTVIEKLHFGRNTTTAEGVYEARGVLLLAVERGGSSLLELSPTRIKQAVTGSGRGEKRDVIRMVERLLQLDEPIRPDDTADALAAAIAGSFHLSSPAFQLSRKLS